VRAAVAQADRDEGRREDGLTTDERTELNRLRDEQGEAPGIARIGWPRCLAVHGKRAATAIRLQLRYQARHLSGSENRLAAFDRFLQPPFCRGTADLLPAD
jgi:hypothetical protein